MNKVKEILAIIGFFAIVAMAIALVLFAVGGAMSLI